MKRLLIFLVAVLALQASAQDTVFVRYNKEWSEEVKYVTDTLVFPGPLARQMLFGTTILHSARTYTLYPYGLHLQRIDFTECDNRGEPAEGFDVIEDIIVKDSSLTIKLKIYDNCCYSFLCEAMADDGGVLNLKYIGYGSNCACNCCFGLAYVFETGAYPKTKPIEAVMINGDRRTLKKITKP